MIEMEMKMKQMSQAHVKYGVQYVDDPGKDRD